MSVLTKILHAGQGRKVKRLHGVVDRVAAFEQDMKALSDDELRGLTAAFRERLDHGEELDDLLAEAFAAVREAATRTIGMRHYDVQLIGGAALHSGAIAEMRTGEGKTLVATLAAYLNALPGKGVHVVTVNDYLAARDAEWMGAVYRALGLTVGALQDTIKDPLLRRDLYRRDITYGKDNEFGFDYLRDNTTLSLDWCVQRGHAYAIVDEVDSVLIDEARTPMILSRPTSESNKLYYQFANIARRLMRDRDYEVEEDKRTTAVTEEGVHRVEQMLGIPNLYDDLQAPLVHYLEAAIKAKELYKRDVDYIVRAGEVLIVDEFTGRVMEGRRWSDGIHQSVEAKEGLKIQEESRTEAKITVQNYFRLYDKLSGMTGTAMTEAGEFHEIYKLEVIQIPTHRPMVRLDRDDLIYKTAEAKWAAVLEDIKERNERGQPVLVGTVSIERNEQLSKMLSRQGIGHELLNAKNHEREAEIIAQAGSAGAVTVATNMAGRGVDIILGGNLEGRAKHEAAQKGLAPETPEFEATVKELMEQWQPQWQSEHDKVVELGGLYVLGTERHESRRIDNQLRGRSGRQGDPGESRFYLSLEDDLMQRFASSKVGAIMDTLRIPEDMPIEAKLVTRAIASTQRQVEQQNFAIRKDVIKYDDVLNTQRSVIYAERRKVLEGEDISEQARRFVEEVLTDVVMTYCPAETYEEEWDVEALITGLHDYFPHNLTAEELSDAGQAEIIERVLAAANQVYEQREAEFSPEFMRLVEREVLLRVIDFAWRDHLDEMESLQEGIYLRAMGQRDPLVEYQREGYDYYEQMMARIRDEFVKYIFHVQKVTEEPAAPVSAELREVKTDATPGPVRPAQERMRQAVGEGDELPAQPTVRHQGPKVGRNDLCPCGSGKKYKKCHGAAAASA